MAAGLAVALAREGMPFRKAHHLVGSLVAEAQKSGRSLKAVAAEKLRDPAPAVAGPAGRALRPARGREGEGARGRDRARRGARFAPVGSRPGLGRVRLTALFAASALAAGCASDA